MVNNDKYCQNNTVIITTCECNSKYYDYHSLLYRYTRVAIDFLNL